MPTATLRPNANSSVQFNSYNVSVPNYQAMSDGSDTSYVYWNATAQGSDATDLYTMADMPADAGSITPPIVLHIRCNQDPGGSGTAFATVHDGTGGDGAQVGMAGSTSVVESTGNYNDCPGSTGWTVAQVNGIYGKIYSNFTVTVYPRDLWLVVTYVQAGSMFVSIWQLAGIALFGGAGLLRREFNQMVLMAARNGVRFSPGEAECGWREYKNGLAMPHHLVLT